jgi:hypothetical protein
MPKTATRAGNRLMDRPEYASKQKPLTAKGWIPKPRFCLI